MLQRIFFLVCQLTIFSLFVEIGYGQSLQWQSFTSVGIIQDIDIGNGRVWSGSNGGVLQLQMDNNEITKFTNTEGLTSNDVVAVEIDQHGSVWFALFNGILNRYWPETGEWEVIEDYKEQTIQDMVAFGDSIYVALGIGVSLFLIDKKEVKETYVNLGLSSGENLEKIAANSVFIHGQDIWVATDKGLAQSSLTLSNLQAPDNWTQYTTENGLLTNQINQVVVLDSIPYVATKSGVERFINQQWQDVGLLNTNVLAIDILNSERFLPMQTVVILTSEGVFGLNSSDQWQRLGAGLRDVTALKTGADGDIWIGRKDKGLATYSFANNDWQLFETNSPASNNFKDLALDSKGRLWCVSQVGGIHMLDGNLWTNFSTQNGLKSNDQRTVLVDSRDRIWFGSWGGGVTIFEETANSFAITQIDTTDGILAGSDTPAFVVVNHLTSDQFGNVWILNRQADNTRILVANTPDNRWVHFSTSEGIFTPFVLTAAIDRSGRVWIGTEDRGIKVLDYNNTLFDKSDDDFTQGLDASEGLFSNKITAIIEDKDGVVWIGTEQGVNSWFGGQVRSQFGLINDFVNTIGVDARNNKWFGTANGVSVLGADGRIEAHYTTGNSSIINSNIQSFAFNEATGEVWIGTTNGLSRLQTPFTTPKPNLSLLTGYPNPFVIDANTSSGRGFKIINLAENTTVVIYNSAGAKIKTLKDEIQGAQVEWLGRDEDENLVPSGVYVYLAFTDSGISASGKVAVIRR